MTDSKAPTTAAHQYGSTEDELDVLEAANRDKSVEFNITARELSTISQERTRQALLTTLDTATTALTTKEETPLLTYGNIRDVLQRLRDLEVNAPYPDHSKELEEYNQVSQDAANALATVVLHSSPEHGITQSSVQTRREMFGSNGIADKPLDSFCKLCYEALQDFVLGMLLVLGIISIIVETTIGKPEDEPCGTCWLEGAAILASVGIVVLVTAGIDYGKQFAFLRLSKSLHETNTKIVVRDGVQKEVTDDDIVVGDLLLVNSHNQASIPADGVLLQGNDVRVNESSLTGESRLISKLPGDVVLSGTAVAQGGSAKLVVIAVGIHSVAGKIQAQVYESQDYVDTLGNTSEDSPLFVKLDILAKQIGMAGTLAAVVSFLTCCLIGFWWHGESIERLVYYLMVSITVLAVAVPEGLPLAVTLALAFSSNQMMKEENLVKHLDACETMGCATTICTDKTGTLTANKMTTRAVYCGGTNYRVQDPAIHLGDYVKQNGIHAKLLEFMAQLVSICTMDETVLYLNDENKVERSSGNPTEVALLQFVHDAGFSYREIRESTKGRAESGPLAGYLNDGKQYAFSSARKMMSWAVPREGGGYRLYSKGAQEVIVARCTMIVDKTAKATKLTEEKTNEWSGTALAYSRRGMRCLGLAYRDVPKGFDLDSLSSTITNSDGTQAYKAETELVAVGLVGIEDPIRPEVPDAIAKCYTAGIDVRLVTGDNPNTAVSIASQAGILQPFHFVDPEGEKVATNLKRNVMMEGKHFRAKVYRIGEDHELEFDQSAFDKIWPFLRVLARSSPDDKLTLAHGLNQSNLYANAVACKRLWKRSHIKIFPDRQVIAMTGDGTNDAPALKRADIGFAMGLTGTQIAKDAADIILLDDNFASIVTAAKWGRNVYTSIQKFLQFQLTVNFSAVVTALTGSFAYQTSPLAAIQLLWVNLLMDSLASLALASEPPVDELLQEPPVNRTSPMITRRMWANISGQALYQIVVVMLLLFHGPEWFDITPGHVVEEEAFGQNSVHYTIIFNTFVWMQLFNEVNCRKLNGEFNVFKGLLNNPLFCGILIVTSGLQIIIVQYGSFAFHVSNGGLSIQYWGVCLGFGAFSLIVQQVINVLFAADQHYSTWRMQKRYKRNYSLSRRSINGLLERDYNVPIKDD